MALATIARPPRPVLLATFDAVWVAAAMVLVLTLHSDVGVTVDYLRADAEAITLAWALFLVVLFGCGLYDDARLRTTRAVLVASMVAVALGTVILSTAARQPWPGGHPAVAGAFALVVLVGVVGARLVRAAAQRHGFLRPRCVVVGTRRGLREVEALLERHPRARLEVVAMVITEDAAESAELATLVQRQPPRKVIVAAHGDARAAILRSLLPLRCRVEIIDAVTLHETVGREVPLEHVDEQWLLHASACAHGAYPRCFKRVLDVILSVPLLLVAGAFVLPVAAFLVKLGSRGPIFYRQERLGIDGIPFHLVKLRTMRVDAERETGPIWCDEDDPRVTAVGRFLRRYRIDEIPQLWNVLRGEMSLIGPRPERPRLAEDIEAKLPLFRERLVVRPGITGWAQVRAAYAASVSESRRKLELDLYYVKHMSFALDLRIFAATITTVLFGRERAAPASQVPSEATRLALKAGVEGVNADAAPPERRRSPGPRPW
jgi:exopolysaccharide biosynthesis polyprenyl glycosylphosphotransferase